MRIGKILGGVAVVAVAFVVALKASEWFSPQADIKPPVLAQLPPLPPASGASRIIAPITIPLTAIRDAADRAAPRSFAGKAANPAPQLLQNADINWTVARGAITANGAQNVLTMAAPINGNLNVTGKLSSNVQEALGGALQGLLGGNAAKQLGNINVNIKNVNASAEIRGTVQMSAKPMLAANWRIDPNIAGQVNLGDTNLSVSGIKINVPAQVKPTIDKAVNDQLAALQQTIRNDPMLEQTARREWTKLCRSIPLQGASGMQGLYLELKPTRAVAAQPRVQGADITLTLGVEAQTRITTVAAKPDCPFPATLDIVPQAPGNVKIAVPIDMPFTDINKIIETQFAGKTFPEDGSGSVDVTVKRASVAAAGDRLLVSLLVNAKEKRSWFGFGGEATVSIWGKPVLDQANQIVRLDNLELAVESEAAFGLLGAAARAAIPLLKDTLAERTTVDLTPLASMAQKKIAEAMADFQRNESGVRVDADITALRLAGITFDSKTMRVTAEADGAINVALKSIPGL